MLCFAQSGIRVRYVWQFSALWACFQLLRHQGRRLLSPPVLPGALEYETFSRSAPPNSKFEQLTGFGEFFAVLVRFGPSKSGILALKFREVLDN